MCKDQSRHVLPSRSAVCDILAWILDLTQFKPCHPSTRFSVCQLPPSRQELKRWWKLDSQYQQRYSYFLHLGPFSCHHLLARRPRHSRKITLLLICLFLWQSVISSINLQFVRKCTSSRVETPDDFHVFGDRVFTSRPWVGVKGLLPFFAFPQKRKPSWGQSIPTYSTAGQSVCVRCCLCRSIQVRVRWCTLLRLHQILDQTRMRSG